MKEKIQTIGGWGLIALLSPILLPLALVAGLGGASVTKEVLAEANES